MTGTPSSLKYFEVVLFPVAAPPVSPIKIIVLVSNSGQALQIYVIVFVKISFFFVLCLVDFFFYFDVFVVLILTQFLLPFFYSMYSKSQGIYNKVASKKSDYGFTLAGAM